MKEFFTVFNGIVVVPMLIWGLTMLLGFPFTFFEIGYLYVLALFIAVGTLFKTGKMKPEKFK